MVKTTNGEKVMNPVMVPEEPSDIHQGIGNQIPGVEIEENLDSIIKSIMTPMIIHHTHAEEDEFESVEYNDETIDCGLPLHLGDQLDPRVQQTCADKIPGLGECPPKDLKIGDEWGGQVLNMGLFSSSFKRPRHPNGLLYTQNVASFWVQ